MTEANLGLAQMPGELFVSEAVWQTYRDLGKIACETGQLNLSVRLLREALKYARQMPNNALNMGTTASELALVYALQRRFKQATSMLRQVIVLYERLLGEEHPYIAALTCDLAFIYGCQGRGPYCARMYKRAQEILENTMPAGCAQVQDAFRTLGSQLMFDERLKQANGYFSQKRAAGVQMESGVGFAFPQPSISTHTCA